MQLGRENTIFRKTMHFLDSAYQPTCSKQCFPLCNVVVSNSYKIFVRTPEGKRPLERPRHRWEDNIRVDVKEIVWGRCGLDACGLE
jgi:hypothetical protein